MVEDGALHLQHHLRSVGICTDIDEIAQTRRIDFFVLCSNKQAGDTEELEAVLLERLYTGVHVAVDEVDGHEQSLVSQLELAVHID